MASYENITKVNLLLTEPSQVSYVGIENTVPLPSLHEGCFSCIFFLCNSDVHQ